MNATTASPRSLILNIYGAYIRRMGGWLAVADLVTMLADLGQDEQTTRSATSRMKKAGLLRAESRSGLAGYALTDQALGILSDGDERIFKSNVAADLSEGWVIAVFSVPEHQRDRRHQLRSRLVWLGFGQVAPGVWIAPRRMLNDTRRILERLDLARFVSLFEGKHVGFEASRDLIHRTWDLAELESLYSRFVCRHEPEVERWGDGSGCTDREAFVAYTIALSEWRRLPYMDPGLPPELLPDDWVGQRARNLFADLVTRLEQRAFTHVSDTVRRT